MADNKYYDGTKLLSLNDINGNKPEIYLCTSNRTAGKTYFFSRMLVNAFIKKGKKFALFYRYNYELENCAKKFFNDIQSGSFPDYEMTSKSCARGSYHELYLNKQLCGYAVSLNSADILKKYSHIFHDVVHIFMDEFQTESSRYCQNEIQKFISLHTSIARGFGEQVRYVPVYMCSNPVSLLNPYFVELGIAERLSAQANFLRGDGWVLEQHFNEAASKSQLQSGFNKAFSSNSYVAYSSESVYLNDNNAFIEKPTGMSRYLATLRYNNADYAIREYSDTGIIYCDKTADMSFPFKIAVTTDDHNVNYVMLKNNELFLMNLRYFFEKGCFRFRDLSCKEAILQALSY